MEEFRTKFDYIYEALDVSERPTDSALRSLMFEQFKNHPKMALVIDKFRNASTSSSKRTAQWSCEKMVEVIDRDSSIGRNTQSVDKSLSQMGSTLMQHQSHQTNQERVIKPPKGDKDRQVAKLPKSPNKLSKADKPDKGAKEVDAAAAKGKGKKDIKGKGNKGKDDKGQSPSPRLTPEEMKKKPCMYKER